MSRFTPDVRRNQNFFYGRIYYIGDKRGNGSVKTVQNYNAIVFGGGKNHACHCAEFKAAKFSQNVNAVIKFRIIDL